MSKNRFTGQVVIDYTVEIDDLDNPSRESYSFKVDDRPSPGLKGLPPDLTVRLFATILSDYQDTTSDNGAIGIVREVVEALESAAEHGCQEEAR
jgi:hypothetical protein